VKFALNVAIMSIAAYVAWLLPGFDGSKVPTLSIIAHNLLLMISGMIAIMVIIND